MNQSFHFTLFTQWSVLISTHPEAKFFFSKFLATHKTTVFENTEVVLNGQHMLLSFGNKQGRKKITSNLWYPNNSICHRKRKTKKQRKIKYAYRTTAFNCSQTEWQHRLRVHQVKIRKMNKLNFTIYLFLNNARTIFMMHSDIHNLKHWQLVHTIWVSMGHGSGCWEKLCIFFICKGAGHGLQKPNKKRPLMCHSQE